jgi:hypothetical protein
VSGERKPSAAHLRNQLPIPEALDPRPRVLLQSSTSPKPTVLLIEHPDPDGRRWQFALELLLEAGRLTAEADPD